MDEKKLGEKELRVKEVYEKKLGEKDRLEWEEKKEIVTLYPNYSDQYELHGDSLAENNSAITATTKIRACSFHLYL